MYGYYPESHTPFRGSRYVYTRIKNHNKYKSKGLVHARSK